MAGARNSLQVKPADEAGTQHVVSTLITPEIHSLCTADAGNPQNRAALTAAAVELSGANAGLMASVARLATPLPRQTKPAG